MRVAKPIVLTDDQKRELSSVASSRTVSVRFTQRARMILLVGEGNQDIEIAVLVGSQRQTVARWRGRFLGEGIACLGKDRPRGGRRVSVTTPEKLRAIIERTTKTNPPDVTHWSTRSMAQVEGVSEKTVRQVWKAHGLRPHQVNSFKLSNDRHFAEKLAEIVGLYLSPPEQALVLSCDEKSQIQALDRTQPGLPLRKGKVATMTHD